jgi:hypothetical protein
MTTRYEAVVIRGKALLEEFLKASQMNMFDMFDSPPEPAPKARPAPAPPSSRPIQDEPVKVKHGTPGPAGEPIPKPTAKQKREAENRQTFKELTGEAPEPVPAPEPEHGTPEYHQGQVDYHASKRDAHQAAGHDQAAGTHEAARSVHDLARRGVSPSAVADQMSTLADQSSLAAGPVASADSGIREKHAPEHRRLSAHYQEKASDHFHRGEQSTSKEVQQAHRAAASSSTDAAHKHVRALESGTREDRDAAYAAGANAARLTSEASQLESSREDDQVLGEKGKKTWQAQEKAHDQKAMWHREQGGRMHERAAKDHEDAAFAAQRAWKHGTQAEIDEAKKAGRRASESTKAAVAAQPKPKAAPKAKAKGGACGVPPGGGWTRTKKGWKKGQGKTYRWLPQDWCKDKGKDSQNGRDKMASAQKEAQKKNAHVAFTGVSHKVTDQHGETTTHETLDHARQHVAESIATTGGKASGKRQAASKRKPAGDGGGAGVRGDGTPGQGAAGRADEGAGEGQGGAQGGAPGPDQEVKHATEAVPGPFQDPDGEKVPSSPALYPGEDPAGFEGTLPPVPEDLRLPESIIAFPNPAPLYDSDGNLTGHIERLYDHQREGAERILAAWEHSDGMVLQDDAGLGKTNTALAALVANGGKRNLIVVPTNGKEGLKRQWMGEKCAGLYGIDVRGVDNLSATEDGTYCVSYDELLEQETNPDGSGKFVTVGSGAKAKQKKVMRIKPEFMDGTWDTIFFDESHNMKGSGERAEAAITLQQKADKVCYMSATPYQNVSDMHYLVRMGLFGDGPEEFAKWAERAGANVDGNVVKDPSSPLPMAAVSATLHVDGLSLKRITSLEGCSNEFNQLLMEGVPEDKRVAFDLADELLAEVGDSIDEGIQKALYTGWAKQYWEVLKVPEAIEMGKKYAAEGKQVAFFTSYKNADHAHLRALPRMLRRRAERLSEQDKEFAARMLQDKARNCEEILEQMPKAGSAVEMLTEAFGGSRVVAEIHGNTSKKPADEQDRYQEGRKKVVVATMARGGTGISLHDTTGESPRVQINLSLPWSGREYAQVAGRSHRLGSKSSTIMHWLMGDHTSERHNAGKVAHRLKSMGALCAGDPELTQDSTGLANWGAGMNSVTSSDDVEDSIKALEDCIEESEDGGDGGKLSQEAQESRDFFMEFARARAEGRDVLGERHDIRMEKKRRMEFREARRAAQQIRQFTARGPHRGGHPDTYTGLEIHWRPGLGENGVWEVHKGSQYAKVFNPIKTKGIGGEHKPYLDSFWVTSDKLPLLAQKMNAHKEKVDLNKLARPENFDPAKRSPAHVLRDRFAELDLKLIPVTNGGTPIMEPMVDTATGKELEGSAREHREAGGVHGREGLLEHTTDDPNPRWGIVSIKPKGKQGSAYKYRGSPMRSAGAEYNSSRQIWHFPAGKAEQVLENIGKVDDGSYDYGDDGYSAAPRPQRTGYRSRWRRSLPGGRMQGVSGLSTYQEAVNKGWGLLQDFMAKGGKDGEGSRGGNVIGHTSSGKPIYRKATAGEGYHSRHKKYEGFTVKDHQDAAAAHSAEADKHSAMSQGFNDQAAQAAQYHQDAAVAHGAQANRMGTGDTNPMHHQRAVKEHGDHHPIEHHVARANDLWREAQEHPPSSDRHWRLKDSAQNHAHAAKAEPGTFDAASKSRDATRGDKQNGTEEVKKSTTRSEPMGTRNYSDMLKGSGRLPFDLCADRGDEMRKGMVSPGVSGIDVPENIVDGIVEIVPPGTGGFDSEDPPDRIQDMFQEPADAVVVTKAVPGTPGAHGRSY